MSKKLTCFLFLLLFLLLVIARWEALFLPYFWDEMGVYGNGIQYLYKNGNAFFPSGLPPEISRGHPLLFYSIHTFILQVFGNQFWVSHSFALFISFSCIVACYQLARVFLNRSLAMFCAIILSVQNIFLAQSTLIIPEIFISLLVLLSFTAYFKKHYLLSACIAAFGVLIKESFIIVPAFLALMQFRYFFSKTDKTKIFKAFWYIIPLLVLLIYLQIQHQTYGWYFFPYHTDIVKTDAIAGFWDKLNRHYDFIFFKQGRNQWLIFILIALFSLAFQKRNRKILILIAFVCYSLFLFSFAFYMDRYLLYLFPILSILLVYGIQSLTSNKLLQYLILISLILSSIVSYQKKNFNYDANINYVSVVKSQVECVNYVCNELNDTTTIYTDFPLNMALNNSSLLYIDSECKNHINLEKKLYQAEYCIYFNNQHPPKNYQLTKSILTNELGFYIYKKQ